MVQIHLKKEPSRQDEQMKISAKLVVREHFNKLLGDFNRLLSDYRSIQEHEKRNRIIEFVAKKAREMSLLRVFVRGAYYYRYLYLQILRKQDCMDQCNQLSEMANFIAGMHDNIKMSFIPPHNVVMALQSFIDPRKLLVTTPSGILRETADRAQTVSSDETKMSGTLKTPAEIDFTDIHRLMRIYLLREDIPHCEVSNGLLFIRSEFFTFELALCGVYQNPEWMLISVKSTLGDANIEQHIFRRVKPPIANIMRFIRFFEARRHAHDTFTALRASMSGFYRRFSGEVDGCIVHGLVDGSKFTCTIEKNGKRATFIDSKASDIMRAVDVKEVREEEHVSVSSKFMRGFMKNALGNNYTFFIRGVFVCFPAHQPGFYIGEYPSVYNLRYHKISIRTHDSSIIGFCEEGQDVFSDMLGEPGPSIQGTGNFQLSLTQIERFVAANSTVFEMFFRLLAFDRFLFLSNGAIFSRNFIINSIAASGFEITFPSNLSDHFEIPRLIRQMEFQCPVTTLRALSTKEALDRAMLIRCQSAVPSGFTVLENEPGCKIVLEADNIKVLIENTLKTDLKILTEDCRRFTYDDALIYIRNFSIFYRHNLIPLTYTTNTIVYNMFDLAAENLIIIRNGSGYRVIGNSTKKLLELESEFDEGAVASIIKIARAYFINRFYTLKRISRDEADEKNTVRLPEGQRIMLTSEGFKFYDALNAPVEAYTKLLNTDRDVVKSLNREGVRLVHESHDRPSG